MLPFEFLTILYQERNPCSFIFRHHLRTSGISIKGFSFSFWLYRGSWTSLFPLWRSTSLLYLRLRCCINVSGRITSSFRESLTGKNIHGQQQFRTRVWTGLKVIQTRKLKLLLLRRLWGSGLIDKILLMI